MAIRMRRGVFDNFDPTRMLPGEWAVVLSGDPDAADGYAVYMCFAPGSVKRMATYEDMVENVDEATADIIQAALDGLAEEIAHINAEALPDMSAGQRGIAKLGSGLAMANSALKVNASGIDTGTLPVSHGGTGATAASGARANLDAAQSESAAGSLYDAEQAIADNAASIASLGESVSRTSSWSQTNFTSSTTLAYTGVSVTIPRGSLYVLEVSISYRNSTPQEIVLGDRSDTCWHWQRYAYHGNECQQVSYAGTSPINSDLTMYVWARYSGSNTEVVTVSVTYLPAK